MDTPNLFIEYGGMAFLVILGIVFLVLYVKNFIKAISAVRRQEYTFNTALRVTGIFVFFVGIIMGAV